MIALTLIVVAGIPAIVMLRMYLRRRAQEELHGYTLFGRRRQDLPKLEPSTGIVIRAAGEPYPPFGEMRRRHRAAQATG